MKVDQALEEKLWSVTREKPLDQETSDRIIDYLLARLSDFLQQPLEIVGENRMHETAFSTTIRGAIAPQEPFRITFVGALGMQVIDKEFGPHYSATLFLFGDHHRLSAGTPNRSVIELFYERDADNIGRWQSSGWEIDEFDEYEDIVEDEYYYKESDAEAVQLF